MSEPQAEVKSPARRWWRWPNIIRLLILLVFAGWLWHFGHQYHIVGRYSCNEGLQPLASGFLAVEDCRHFVFRDWRGEVRWRVDTKSVSDSEYSANPYVYAVSPNGHTLATVVSSDREQYQLVTWRDGRENGRVALPQARYYDRCWAFNDGRGILSGKLDRKVEGVFVIQGSRILASATGYHLHDVAPDGSAACFDTWTKGGQRRLFADLTVRDGQLCFDNRLDQPQNYLYSIPQLFSNGTVLDYDGSLHRHGKRVGKAAIYSHGESTPDGSYALMYRKFSVKVFSPTTGDAWQFTLPHTAPWQGTGFYENGLDNFAPSADGRIVSVMRREEQHQGLRKYLQRFHLPDQWLKHEQYQYLEVYQRPGRCIARMHINEQQLGGERYYVSFWYPTPDPRRLLGNVEMTNPEKSWPYLHDAVLMERWW